MAVAISPRIGGKRDLSPPAEQALEKKARSRSPESQHVIGPASSTKPKAKQQKQGGKRRLKKLTNIEPCSHDDVHWHEVCELLGQDAVDDATEEGTLFESPFAFREEVELHISRLSSNGSFSEISSIP